MKVLLLNGSPNEHGCTYTALCEVARALKEGDVETETLWIGNRAVRGCIGCGGCAKNGRRRCVFEDDLVNAALDRMQACDGLVVGSPVHYAAAGGSITSFLDRMFYAGGSLDLATQQSAMWMDCDTSDAGDAIVLMRAVKDVMYALVNSNAMNAEVIGYNPPIWQEYLHWINIGAFTLVGVWLVLAIVRTVRCNKRQKAKIAAANAAK